MLGDDGADEVDVYSAFSFERDREVVASLEGGALKPKASLLAVQIAARVFARVRDVGYRQDGDVHRVVVRREDGRRVWVVWSSSDTREQMIKKPDDAEVFGAPGNRLDEDDVVLTPRPHPAPAGTVKYVLLDEWSRS